MRITSWFALQPDVQYVVHPGGAREFANALVVGIRSAISF
jgi:carbohydrate-selective porin OprB